MTLQPSSKVIVFTDIHIDVDQRPDAPNAEDRLRAGIQHVMAHQSDADRVIITGDLTHHGDIASYERLRALLTPLKLPTHLMLGNHDNRENFLHVFPDTATDPNGFVQCVIDTPDTRLVLLDTLFGPPYDYPASHAGKLCDQRLNWLEHAMTGTENPCVLFMHHPPMPTGFAAMDSIMLQDAGAFYEATNRAGGARHLICGHIHRTISGTHRGLSYSMFKSFVGQMPMNFVTIDTKTEVHEPPAYGILLTTSQGLVVHFEDFLLDT